MYPAPRKEGAQGVQETVSGVPRGGQEAPGAPRPRGPGGRAERSPASSPGQREPQTSVKEGLPQQVMPISPRGPTQHHCLPEGLVAVKGPPGCEPGPASQHAYLGAAPGPRLGPPSRRRQPAVWTRGAAAGPDTRSGRRPRYQGPRAAGEQAQGERVLARDSRPPATSL